MAFTKCGICKEEIDTSTREDTYVAYNTDWNPLGFRHVNCFPPINDTINHPQHYGGDTTYEAIKVIEAWNLNFRLGNTVKYIRRSDLKGEKLQDLKKALWYLEREITKLEQNNES